MKQSSLFALILISSITFCFAQNIKMADKNIVQFRAIEKIVKRDGWNIPKDEKMVAYTSENLYIEDYPVIRQRYKLSKTFEMKWDFYSLRLSDNSLFITEPGYKIEVRAFAMYLAEGKIFAYELRGVPTEITLNGFRSYAGAIVTAYFTDEDGDEIFETRYLNKLPNKIPGWIPKDKYKIETTPPPPPPIKKVL